LSFGEDRLPIVVTPSDTKNVSDPEVAGARRSASPADAYDAVIATLPPGRTL
jgi:hypothetical protein